MSRLAAAPEPRTTREAHAHLVAAIVAEIDIRGAELRALIAERIGVGVASRIVDDAIDTAVELELVTLRATFYGVHIEPTTGSVAA